MDIQQKLLDFFADSGFTKSEVIPEQLTYTPELLVSKDKELKIFHIKDDHSKIKDSIIQRIAQARKIPNSVYEQYLVFHEKPKLPILRACKLYGLGIYYLNGKEELEIYAEPKEVKGRKKKSQIPNTKIFFSSKQDLNERSIAKRTIDVHRDANKIPVFANLVEEDQRYDNTIDNLLEIINDCMDDSSYVLAVLSEEYREIVDQEIRRALDIYETEEILLFLKNNKESKESWSELLKHIQLHYKVKYTEYWDDRDFEIKFTRRFMVVVKALHKKHNVEYLE
ncbi:hypothetical protein KUV23_03505 [Algoriphagus marincola]|uniref:TIR domain-containing protein n=1 Tax=Algoriphagus marincola TaxID=264027 RepID=A0ABS7N128_9BACT|nr:hypothetical protein [Algoriphagus marincola]MBY5950024.1 hypothetical protein [Algoriphagus marincola]